MTAGGLPQAVDRFPTLTREPLPLPPAVPAVVPVVGSDDLVDLPYGAGGGAMIPVRIDDPAALDGRDVLDPFGCWNRSPAPSGNIESARSAILGSDRGSVIVRADYYSMGNRNGVDPRSG
jgi:hypothetical protein